MSSTTKINPTPSPSFKRFLDFSSSKNKISLFRWLQYEQLFSIRLNGRTLDIGGGKKAHYLKKLIVDQYFSINIDNNMEPTWTTKPGKKLPAKSSSFDNLLCLNTVEHLFEPDEHLRESCRVLKNGGTYIAVTPFLFRVHPSPEDFFRPTAQWWNRSLSEKGFENIEVTPLLWGPFSNGAFLSGLPGPLKNLRLKVSLLMDITYHFLKFGRASHFGDKKGQELQNNPLGYFIKAQKK